ncbi:hypothetical protein HMPREF3027_06620 [Porphyromonas sp. HMSC077F02]|nr:hypothetical protein HMPREF3027_06620 [Porphyromonas sp. HMSC077F02]
MSKQNKFYLWCALLGIEIIAALWIVIDLYLEVGLSVKFAKILFACGVIIVTTARKVSSSRLDMDSPE